MRLIGALASGESPSAAEASDALTVLNQMMDAWSADRLQVFTINIGTFPLVPGQQVYTLGTGGNFNAPRPARIDRISIVSLTNPAQPLELDIKIYTDQDWQGIPVKNITTTLPLGVYPDGSFPFNNLSYWPIPNVVVNTILYGWTALTQFPDLVTDETFPPGYLEALRYNLAVRLIAEMPGNYNPVTMQAIMKIAVESLARIRSMNLPTVQAHYGDIPGGGGGRYDYRSDTIAGRRG